MSISYYQRSFNGGEVSESMFSRIDDGKYQTGLAKCSNFLIEPQGPIVRRPGTAYVNHVKNSGKARLIPFTFSVTQTMVLEFGPYYIRFHTNGKTLMNGSQPYEVATPYREEDLFDIHYVQSADVMTLVHPSYPPKELRRYSALDWRLVDITFRTTLTPPTGLSVSQSIDASVSNPTFYRREYAVTSLLADGTMESVKSSPVSVQCNPYGSNAFNTISWNTVPGASLYRVYRNQGGVWSYIGQTSGNSIIDENIKPDSSITPPNYDNPFYSNRGIESVTVVNGGGGYFETGRVVNVSGTPRKCQEWDYLGHVAVLPNSRLTIPFDMASVNSWNAEVLNTGDSAGSGAAVSCVTNLYNGHHRYLEGWTITNGGTGYKSAEVHFRTWSGVKNVLRFEAWYPCTVVTEPIELRVTDSTGYGAELKPVIQNGVIVGVLIINGGQNYTNPTITVVSNSGRGASFSCTVGNAQDFPGAVSYFEQRRWFGGTAQKPNNLWATRSGTESDMSYCLPSHDDDRIAVRIAAREANRIQHIVPLAQLLLLTGSTEWRVSPLNSDAITPSSMSVRPQSYVGSNNVQPLVISNTAVYAASRGGHLREMGYSYEAGGYVTGDMCLRAPHLFDNLDIVDLAYSKAPWPIIWIVSSSGKLIACTYVPEQQVGAFSTVETAGDVESVCVVAENEEDILYVVVRRILNGQYVRFIERMYERQSQALVNGVFLDCSGTYRGAPTKTISGLHWLEGMTVGVLADGAVEPDKIVVNGQITLTSEASVVHVGIPYTAEMKTLPVAAALQDGSYGSGHQKNVKEVFFRVINSSGIEAGPDAHTLAEYPARGTEFAGSAPNPISDEFGFAIYPQWSPSGQVFVRQKYPLPLRIISMTSVVEMK